MLEQFQDADPDRMPEHAEELRLGLVQRDLHATTLPDVLTCADGPILPCPGFHPPSTASLSDVPT
ncbi:hypothetical protein GCM10010282_56350 [Streptomyces roseolus]|nr:hypothetical protein GCM10010282_56350 [Streptomyces roseolus]